LCGGGHPIGLWKGVISSRVKISSGGKLLGLRRKRRKDDNLDAKGRGEGAISIKKSFSQTVHNHLNIHKDRRVLGL